MDEKLYGKIKVLKDSGYGYIAMDSGEDIFFHRLGLTRPELFNSLKLNATVSFCIGYNDRNGMTKAVGVEVL